MTKPFTNLQVRQQTRFIYMCLLAFLKKKKKNNCSGHERNVKAEIQINLSSSLFNLQKQVCSIVKQYI